jgi:hypothetical protein
MARPDLGDGGGRHRKAATCWVHQPSRYFHRWALRLARAARAGNWAATHVPCTDAKGRTDAGGLYGERRGDELLPKARLPGDFSSTFRPRGIPITRMLDCIWPPRLASRAAKAAASNPPRSPESCPSPSHSKTDRRATYPARRSGYPR